MKEKSDLCRGSRSSLPDDLKILRIELPHQVHDAAAPTGKHIFKILLLTGNSYKFRYFYHITASLTGLTLLLVICLFRLNNAIYGPLTICIDGTAVNDAVFH